MKKKINILGSGVAGLSCASFLAQAGHEVTVFEKNPTIGGRARQFEADGFTFDMGPSWYWMPEVFEKFYNKFGHTTSDFYELKRLDPSYRIFWQDDSQTDIPASLDEFYALFEQLEPGSSVHLKKFLAEAAYKYDVGVNDLVHRPSLSWLEFLDKRVISGLFKMHLTNSFSGYIRKYFKHPKILSLLEFPILFLGAMPKDTPALYSLMNYADIELGTWYPMGGMYKIIEAFEKIAIEQGVKIQTSSEVSSFDIYNNKATHLNSNHQKFEADYFISGADYHHTDQVLLKGNSNYTEKYWDNRKMAPSCLLFYIGVNKEIPNLLHHNLFFDEDFDQHAVEIYQNPSWPKAPLFYVCCPSKTDDSVAPKGMENLFLLVPLAPNLQDSEAKREEYFDLILSRLEKRTKTSIKENIVYKKSYCIDDFKNDYHAYKGNAYGLANTLMQTAKLKPSIKHKTIQNVYFTGQLTVPGPGVPPSIISGEVVAKQVLKQIKRNTL
ncbi:MAG: phytoene desaturase family protein [Flavobacteriia bacterium]|jgi:phytoene desaturase